MAPGTKIYNKSACLIGKMGKIPALLLLLAVLLAFGCITQEDGVPPADPLARCTSACQENYPNTVADISNGTCSCPCENGYARYKGACITYQEYNYMLPAICSSECEANYPHSHGAIRNGTCHCPCEKGYVTYNQTCITPEDFQGLAPVLCSKDHPVLKIYDWLYREKSYYVYLCYQSEAEGNISEDRSRRYDYWNFVGDPYSNGSVSIVTDLLTNISRQEGFSEYERVEFAIAFVQSLPYTYDNVTTPYDDYPRFPSETIYADGGDCEDTSILMAAVLKKMGYDVVLLELPRHMATGVSCNPSDFDYTVSSYPYNGRDYCYLETTGEGFGMGQLPSDFSPNTNVTVIPLRSPQPDIYLGWGQEHYFQYVYTYNSRDTYVNVTDIRVDNFGTLPAKNVKIDVALESTEEGKVWDQYTLSAGDIPVRGYYNAYFTNLHAPSGQSFRVSLVVYGDNFQPAESKGGWVTWH